MTCHGAIWRAAAVLGTCLLASLTGASPAGAAPAGTEQIVYDVQAYDGLTYGEALYPRSQQTLYLLAGVPNAMVVARTRVYYWAPQNKELADWSTLNQPITGTLEVADSSGRVVQVLNPQPYILWFAQGSTAGPARLLSGRRAIDAYLAYLRAQQVYTTAQQRYQTLRRDYDNRLAAYIGAVARLRRQGKPVKSVPPPHAPALPVAPLGAATAPSLAYLLTLPTGSYELRMRGADGHMVAGSARSVHVFTSRRTGIGYMAIPEDRWTYPVAADGGLPLYLPAPGTVYLQPFAAAEYNDRDYARLHEPQSTQGQPDTWVWTHQQPLSPSLALAYRPTENGPASTGERVAFGPYYARQTEGSTLGYTIVPYRPELFPGEAPSFAGYRVPVSTGGVRVTLVGTDGRTVSGSELQIGVAHLDARRALFAPALLPLLVGLAVLLLRELRR